MVLIKEERKNELFYTNLIDDTLAGFYYSTDKGSREPRFMGFIADRSTNQYLGSGRWIWEFKNVYFI